MKKQYNVDTSNTISYHLEVFMKRFISFILILCVMSLLAVSFVSCDTPVEPNEETNEAESSESIDSETPQDTESKLPKTMVKDVEEWCKVFDFDN